ncbi:MAG: GNAT family N-acetyltransferase [Lachnospiraceae bacterium]|nr:GNAT family N-acetyltransferase [Lachnospiraceae bacterium]
MEIHLARASVLDAEEIWNMQIEAFRELLEKYQDYETNPGSEPVEKVLARLEQPQTYYYFIMAGEHKAGAIRVVDFKNDSDRKRISPIFIMPEFRNRGYAQEAIASAEKLHGDRDWELDTILQEPGNCHLYERMGYRRTGKTKQINEKMTLVFYVKE